MIIKTICNLFFSQNARKYTQEYSSHVRRKLVYFISTSGKTLKKLFKVPKPVDKKKKPLERVSRYLSTVPWESSEKKEKQSRKAFISKSQVKVKISTERSQYI